MLPAPSDPAEIQDRLWEGAEGELAFDVGANMGQSVGRMLDAGFTRVIAFEPCAESYAVAAQAWDGNPAVDLRREAVSDREGVLTLAERAAPIQTGQLVAVAMPYHGEHMEDAPGMANWGPETGRRDIACTTLDAVAARSGMPDFVKVDTEGHEGQVLSGAGAVLAAGKTAWLIEFHNRELYGQCRDLLEGAGYSAETVRHPHYPEGSWMYYHHGWLRAFPEVHG